MKPMLFCISIILTTNLCASQISEIPQETEKAARLSWPMGFVKGFSWGTFGGKEDYIGAKAEFSMRQLAQTCANFVCIVFSINMKTKDSVQLLWDKTNPDMASDQDIRNAISLAKENKLEVILKPAVNCNDGTWRAMIDFKTPDGKPDMERWRQWWRNYTAAMLHYVALAGETECQAFCVGCELSTTEEFEAEWRELIAQLRKNFKGVLVYNVNHGREEQLKWWDAVDLIGISAYYPVGAHSPSPVLTENMQKLDYSPTPEIMKSNWQQVKERLSRLALRWNRPVLFIEIGACSYEGSSATPWEYRNSRPYDGRQQADFYQTAMETFWNEPWFAGFTWWAWECSLYSKEQADSDTGYCPYGKPAEAIVRQWYEKKRE